MRRIEYLSPTSIAKFEEDLEEFYLLYLADTRAPRFSQTRPMSIGSAFDAYVKSFLHEKLFGKNKDSKFDLKTLFEAQVEEANRDWAWEHGSHAFECYKRSGALADLLLELGQSIGTPRFEIEIKGAVNGHREGVTKQMDNGVTFLGKPDVFYINKHGVHVILDFKVNGWCSRSPVSPMPGYIRIRSGNGNPILTGPHKDCMLMPFKGTLINHGSYLEQKNKEWATQLAIYSWLLGVDIGEESIIAIDQLVCKPTDGKFPEVRIAEHRLRIHPDYQWQVFARAQRMWEVVHSNHIFRNLSLLESQDRCQHLEERAKSLLRPATESDAMFNNMTRGTNSKYSH